MELTRIKKPEIVDCNGCAVLVYSSDRVFLDYYRTMVLSLGFTPVTATTPEAAVAILRLMIVASVVVDAEGIGEGFRRVVRRAREAQQHAPVVAVSRKLDADFRHQVKAMGAADCLKHPALRDDMVHVLLTDHAYAKPPVL